MPTFGLHALLVVHLEGVQQETEVLPRGEESPPDFRVLFRDDFLEALVPELEGGLQVPALLSVVDGRLYAAVNQTQNRGASVCQALVVRCDEDEVLVGLDQIDQPRPRIEDLRELVELGRQDRRSEVGFNSI